MKIKSAFFLTVLLALSTGASAATLSALNGVNFLLVNNGENCEFLVKGEKKDIELEPGKYQMVVRYEADLKRGSKNTLFTSKPYVFEVEVGNNDLILSVPRMRVESHAAAFFRNPQWQLTDISSNKNVNIIAVELESSGILSSNKLEKALAQHNQKNNTAFENKNIKKEVPLLVTKLPVNVQPLKSDTFSQMTRWYIKASDEEKKAFKHWMRDRDF